MASESEDAYDADAHRRLGSYLSSHPFAVGEKVYGRVKVALNPEDDAQHRYVMSMVVPMHKNRKQLLKPGAVPPPRHTGVPVDGDAEMGQAEQDEEMGQAEQDEEMGQADQEVEMGQADQEVELGQGGAEQQAQPAATVQRGIFDRENDEEDVKAREKRIRMKKACSQKYMSMYDDMKLRLSRFEDRTVRVDQTGFMTRCLDTENRKVPFPIWLASRVIAQGNPRTKTRDQVSHVFSEGVAAMLQARYETMKDECIEMCKQGGSVWYKLVNMTNILRDLCKFVACDFGDDSASGVERYGKILVMLDNVIDMCQKGGEYVPERIRETYDQVLGEALSSVFKSMAFSQVDAAMKAKVCHGILMSASQSLDARRKKGMEEYNTDPSKKARLVLSHHWYIEAWVELVRFQLWKGLGELKDGLERTNYGKIPSSNPFAVLREREGVKGTEELKFFKVYFPHDEDVHSLSNSIDLIKYKTGDDKDRSALNKRLLALTYALKRIQASIDEVFDRVMSQADKTLNASRAAAKDSNVVWPTSTLNPAFQHTLKIRSFKVNDRIEARNVQITGYDALEYAHETVMGMFNEFRDVVASHFSNLNILVATFTVQYTDAMMLLADNGFQVEYDEKMKYRDRLKSGFFLNPDKKFYRTNFITMKKDERRDATFERIMDEASVSAMQAVKLLREKISTDMKKREETITGMLFKTMKTKYSSGVGALTCAYMIDQCNNALMRSEKRNLCDVAATRMYAKLLESIRGRATENNGNGGSDPRADVFRIAEETGEPLMKALMDGPISALVGHGRMRSRNGNEFKKIRVETTIWKKMVPVILAMKQDFEWSEKASHEVLKSISKTTPPDGDNGSLSSLDDDAKTNLCARLDKEWVLRNQRNESRPSNVPAPKDTDEIEGIRHRYVGVCSELANALEQFGRHGSIHVLSASDKRSLVKWLNSRYDDGGAELAVQILNNENAMIQVEYARHGWNADVHEKPALENWALGNMKILPDMCAFANAVSAIEQGNIPRCCQFLGIMHGGEDVQPEEQDPVLMQAWNALEDARDDAGTVMAAHKNIAKLCTITQRLSGMNPAEIALDTMMDDTDPWRVVREWDFKLSKRNGANICTESAEFVRVMRSAIAKSIKINQPAARGTQNEARSTGEVTNMLKVAMEKAAASISKDSDIQRVSVKNPLKVFNTIDAQVDNCMEELQHLESMRNYVDSNGAHRTKGSAFGDLVGYREFIDEWVRGVAPEGVDVSVAAAVVDNMDKNILYKVRAFLYFFTDDGNRWNGEGTADDDLERIYSITDPRLVKDIRKHRDEGTRIIFNTKPTFEWTLPPKEAGAPETAGELASRASKYIEKRIKDVQGRFTKSDVESMEKAYSRVALLEEYNANLRQGILDSACMLNDVCECIRFLMVQLGCGHEVEGAWDVPKRSSSSANAQQRRGAYSVVSDRPRLSTTIAIPYDEKPDKDTFTNDVNRIYGTRRRRNPAHDVTFVACQTGNEEIPMNMSHTPRLTLECYVKDVMKIRKVLRYVLADQELRSKKKTGSRSGGGVGDDGEEDPDPTEYTAQSRLEDEWHSMHGSRILARSVMEAYGDSFVTDDYNNQNLCRSILGAQERTDRFDTIHEYPEVCMAKARFKMTDNDMEITQDVVARQVHRRDTYGDFMVPFVSLMAEVLPMSLTPKDAQLRIKRMALDMMARDDEGYEMEEMSFGKLAWPCMQGVTREAVGTLNGTYADVYTRRVLRIWRIAGHDMCGAFQHGMSDLARTPEWQILIGDDEEQTNKRRRSEMRKGAGNRKSKKKSQKRKYVESDSDEEEDDDESESSESESESDEDTVTPGGKKKAKDTNKNKKAKKRIDPVQSHKMHEKKLQEVLKRRREEKKNLEKVLAEAEEMRIKERAMKKKIDANEREVKAFHLDQMRKIEDAIDSYEGDNLFEIDMDSRYMMIYMNANKHLTNADPNAVYPPHDAHQWKNFTMPWKRGLAPFHESIRSRDEDVKECVNEILQTRNIPESHVPYVSKCISIMMENGSTKLDVVKTLSTIPIAVHPFFTQNVLECMFDKRYRGINFALLIPVEISYDEWVSKELPRVVSALLMSEYCKKESYRLRPTVHEAKENGKDVKAVCRSLISMFSKILRDIPRSSKSTEEEAIIPWCERNLLNQPHETYAEIDTKAVLKAHPMLHEWCRLEYDALVAHLHEIRDWGVKVIEESYVKRLSKSVERFMRKKGIHPAADGPILQKYIEKRNEGVMDTDHGKTMALVWLSRISPVDVPIQKMVENRIRRFVETLVRYRVFWHVLSGPWGDKNEADVGDMDEAISECMEDASLYKGDSLLMKYIMQFHSSAYPELLSQLPMDSFLVDFKDCFKRLDAGVKKYLKNWRSDMYKIFKRCNEGTLRDMEMRPKVFFKGLLMQLIDNTQMYRNEERSVQEEDELRDRMVTATSTPEAGAMAADLGEMVRVGNVLYVLWTNIFERQTQTLKDIQKNESGPIYAHAQQTFMDETVFYKGLEGVDRMSSELQRLEFLCRYITDSEFYNSGARKRRSNRITNSAGSIKKALTFVQDLVSPFKKKRPGIDEGRGQFVQWYARQAKRVLTRMNIPTDKQFIRGEAEWIKTLRRDATVRGETYAKKVAAYIRLRKDRRERIREGLLIYFSGSKELWKQRRETLNKRLPSNEEFSLTWKYADEEDRDVIGMYSAAFGIAGVCNPRRKRLQFRSRGEGGGGDGDGDGSNANGGSANGSNANGGSANGSNANGGGENVADANKEDAQDDSEPEELMMDDERMAEIQNEKAEEERDNENFLERLLTGNEDLRDVEFGSLQGTTSESDTKNKDEEVSKRRRTINAGNLVTYLREYKEALVEYSWVCSMFDTLSDHVQKFRSRLPPFTKIESGRVQAVIDSCKVEKPAPASPEGVQGAPANPEGVQGAPANPEGVQGASPSPEGVQVVVDLSKLSSVACMECIVDELVAREEHVYSREHGIGEKNRYFKSFGGDWGGDYEAIVRKNRDIVAMAKRMIADTKLQNPDESVEAAVERMNNLISYDYLAEFHGQHGEKKMPPPVGMAIYPRVEDVDEIAQLIENFRKIYEEMYDQAAFVEDEDSSDDDEDDEDDEDDDDDEEYDD